jgi:Reverse transcriptase (RNA-dependent DNA polymerase)
VPYTKLFNKTPKYLDLKVLGCSCFPYTRPYNKNKLELRSKQCVFLGYGITQKGYRCLDLSTNKFFISKNIVFDESTFPFNSHENTTNNSYLEEFSVVLLILVQGSNHFPTCQENQPFPSPDIGSGSHSSASPLFPGAPQPISLPTNTVSPLDLPSSTPHTAQQYQPRHTPTNVYTRRRLSANPHQTTGSILGPVPPSIDSLPTATIQSILPNYPSSHQSQHQISSSILIIPSHESQHALPSSPHPISSSESPHIAPSSPPQDLSIPSSSTRPNQPTSLHSSPSDPFLSLSPTQPPAGQSSPLSHLSPSVPTKHSMTTRTQDNTYKRRIFSDFVAHQINLESEPSSFKQAMSSPNWRQAMTDELNALASNGTWILVPPPTNQRIIGCKWVYKIKRRPDGSLERYKARLVAKGYSQEPGINYVETYSPVVRATTIRLILSMAVTSNWSIKQLDVSNAFLNGDLKETVYMHQPQGFGDPHHPDHVCLLKKSLYGLKQAPRA